MNLKCGRIGVVVCLMLISGDVHGFGKRNYRFDGKISRDVLENYLSRSITMTEIYRSPGNLDDDIRMLKNTGAKFAGRTIYLWGGEARIADAKFLSQGREMAARIHQNDPDVVLQAAVFEIVTEGVGEVPVPDWVFEEFGLAPGPGSSITRRCCFRTSVSWTIGGADRRCPTSARRRRRCGCFFWPRRIWAWESKRSISGSST
jgi:hypothetical protein